MPLPDPGRLLLGYTAGLALGAAVRGSYPGGAAEGWSVAAGLLLAAWGAFSRRLQPRLSGGTEEASRYGPRRGLPYGSSFWRRPDLLRGAGWWASLVCLVLAGAARMWAALGPEPPPLEELRRLFPPGLRRSQVFLRGRLIANPQPRRTGQWLVLVRPEGPPGRCGLVRLTVVGEALMGSLQAGMRLSVPVKLYRPEAVNPGEPAFAGVCPEGRLSALGWVAARDLRLEEVGERKKPALLGMGSTVAAAAKERFESFLQRGNRTTGRGILKALLLGDRSALTEETAEDFARAGAMHLLVVSGLHLSIVAIFLGEAARRLRLGRRSSFALTATGVVFYASVTGWTPPVTRAALMALSDQGARLVGRPHDGRRALWLAVGLMLTHRPLLFF
ncbi:MAG TPA: ComEC family competence protein, partial [Firmicutes bacterium]|nr:ComEC family competence protein [Bacillota bacterium]